jgi:Tfp pilus assembly protein PilF
MGRRLDWRALVGVMAFGGPLGCQSSPPMQGPSPMQVSALNRDVPRTAEGLPPEQAGQVCLAAALELESKGAAADAITLYEKARADSPKLDGLCARRLAVLYDLHGELTRSTEEYQRALKHSPRDSNVLNDLGYSYYNRGRLDEAEKTLRQALAGDAGNRRAWVNLGMVLGAAGRDAESLAAFQKAVPAPQAECNLAFILTARGKHDEARALYRRALAADEALVVAREALEKLEKAEGDHGRGGGAAGAGGSAGGAGGGAALAAVGGAGAGPAAGAA